jgi:hypothetical protein
VLDTLRSLFLLMCESQGIRVQERRVFEIDSYLAKRLVENSGSALLAKRLDSADIADLQEMRNAVSEADWSRATSYGSTQLAQRMAATAEDCSFRPSIFGE